MEHRQNDDSCFFRSKVDAKWEPIGNDTANIHVNRRVGHRPLSGGSHTSFDFGNELHAKVWPLAFVPCRRFDEFRAGRTTKVTDRLISRFASAQSPLPHPRQRHRPDWRHGRQAAGRAPPSERLSDLARHFGPRCCPKAPRRIQAALPPTAGELGRIRKYSLANYSARRWPELIAQINIFEGSGGICAGYDGSGLAPPLNDAEF